MTKGRRGGAAETRERIFAAIKSEPISARALAERLGLKTGPLYDHLHDLEAAGRIMSVQAGNWKEWVRVPMAKDSR